MPHFYDSYAIIEILKQNENYLRFGDEVITTTVLNLFEVYYYLLRKYNKKTADFWVEEFDFNFLEITPNISVKASEFRFENRKKELSMVDCIGYISALNAGIRFLTGDKEFKNSKNVEYVK